MKEHPILFSGEMVKALLADRKHVTRRLSKQWLKVKAGDRLWCRETFYCDDHSYDFGVRADIPELRKSMLYRADGEFRDQLEDHADARWRPSIHMPRWASRILLECEEDARAERLQDITEEDALAEGCGADDGLECGECAWLGFEDSKNVRRAGPDEDWHFLCPDCGEILAHWPVDEEGRMHFRTLWDRLHTKPGERWEDNPTVHRVGRFHVVDAVLENTP